MNDMNEIRLNALVDTIVDGVIMIDRTGNILMFNPACERLFGYNSGEVIGRNVKMLMPTPYRDEHDTYIENYHNGGKHKVIGIGREVSGKRKDGTVFPMYLSVGEAKQEDETVFVGIVHDLTELKKTEEQLVQAQKMEAVGQLSGGIAHDFNNLLTVILGNAENLSEHLKVRPDLKKMSDAIVGASERGAELTQRLLAFGRRQTLRPVPVDYNHLVEEMQALLQRTLRGNIEVKTIFDPEQPKGMADRMQLESALLNLALNAQDAMPDGGRLTITTASLSFDENYRDGRTEIKPGEYIVISVTDDGKGMSPDVQKHVFEPFFTTKEVGKGSGLGLSMVYGFIKQSQGHVAIYSEPGLGTNVRLYLPRSKDTGAVVKDANTAIEKKLVGGKETILLVEDEPFVRGYAITCLEDLGYKVLTAINGEDALNQLKNGVIPDILFTDVVMPGGVSGYDLAERAKILNPQLAILLTSGYPLETLIGRQNKHSEVTFLNKPYRKVDLAHRLREVLNTAKEGKKRERVKA